LTGDLDPFHKSISNLDIKAFFQGGNLVIEFQEHVIEFKVDVNDFD
jgi:hypothetical protein